MNKEAKCIASGIFSWNSTERRSERYGSFQMSDSAYNGRSKATVWHDQNALRDMHQARVRLIAKVRAVRKSGHAGDSFLKIVPSTPARGEEIVIGVGFLWVEPSKYDSSTQLALKPMDGRDKFWIDPRILYRLHDQTVDIYAELTNDECSPRPLFKTSKEGFMDNGDGTFQVKGSPCIPPKVEDLGDGMFTLNFARPL